MAALAGGLDAVVAGEDVPAEVAVDVGRVRGAPVVGSHPRVAVGQRDVRAFGAVGALQDDAGVLDRHAAAGADVPARVDGHRAAGIAATAVEDVVAGGAGEVDVGHVRAAGVLRGLLGL